MTHPHTHTHTHTYIYIYARCIKHPQAYASGISSIYRRSIGQGHAMSSLISEKDAWKAEFSELR